MPTLTACPSCAKQLKVPDELLGRQVKCPSCGTEFTASASAAGAAPPPMGASAPAPDYAPRRDDYGQFDQGVEPRPRPKTSSLFGPGIGLLISGILNFLFSIYLIINGVYVMNNPAAAVDMNPLLQGKTEKEKDEMREMIKNVAPGYIIAGALGILFAVVTLIGAIPMMKGQKSTMGWVSAVVSVIPCTAPCCCTGIPIGIWAMIALNKAGQG